VKRLSLSPLDGKNVLVKFQGYSFFSRQIYDQIYKLYNILGWTKCNLLINTLA
jgi:hypothetical protein